MSALNICILDYGLGNTGSIQNMLKRVGYKSVISRDEEDISSAGLIFLPGVGSFDDGMANLQKYDLIPLLEKKVLIDKTPIVGICLGMQLLLNGSEEGEKEGLGWIKGYSKKFNFSEAPSQRLRVPHMGWNYITPSQQHAEIFASDFPELRYYFVHSYYAMLENKEEELCATSYGSDFSSGIRSSNIYGFQFHPEKSHKFGMLLFSNLIKQLVSVKS